MQSHILVTDYSYLIITDGLNAYTANEIKPQELEASDAGYLDIYRINKDTGLVERYRENEWVTMKDWYETFDNS